jgi:hypothetical protein
MNENSLSARDILELWESTWGPLEERWKEEFLNHKDMQAILEFEYKKIDDCIRRTKKLGRLLRLLESTKKVKARRTSSQTLRTGNSGGFGRVTVKTPGKSESVLPGRSTCPSCGMVVTGNDLRCRCT